MTAAIITIRSKIRIIKVMPLSIIRHNKRNKNHHHHHHHHHHHYDINNSMGIGVIDFEVGPGSDVPEIEMRPHLRFQARGCWSRSRGLG